MLLQELVEQDFGLEGRGKWYHSSDHDSLVVNAETQTWFWNSKGLRGNIYDYLVQIRGMTKEQAGNFLKNSFGELSNFEDRPRSSPYDKLIDTFWEAGKTKRDYWYKRCLKDEFIDRYRLGYNDGWYIIPIYKDLEFKNFQCRREEPEKRIRFWYSSGEVYLYNHSILPYTKVIYITEGLVDCILLNQEGLVSVCGTGVNTWKIEWANEFFSIPEIYYFEDNDTAGRIGARLVAKSLGEDRVKIVSFPHKKEKYDVGDFFKDGGTRDSLLEYANNNYHYIFEL